MSKKLHRKYQKMGSHQKNTTFSIIKREMLRDKLALGSFIFIVALSIFVIISAFIIDQMGGLQNNFTRGMIYRPPSIPHLFGTDGRGRSVFWQVIIATRNSFSLIIPATLVSSTFGIAYGLISGYTGGRIDNIMMRFIDCILILPNLILIIALIPMMGGTSMFTFVMLVSLFTWMQTAKMVRVRIIQEKELEYIHASKTLGTSAFKIIVYQLLPHLNTVIIASITLNIVSIIGIEAALSFLQATALSESFTLLPVTPTLGSLVGTARDMGILRFREWMWMPAGLLIAVLVFSINNIGNMLNRAFDPRQRRG